jgi:hypothetical protein
MADANLQPDAPEIITDEQAFWNTPLISQCPTSHTTTSNKTSK